MIAKLSAQRESRATGDAQRRRRPASLRIRVLDGDGEPIRGALCAVCVEGRALPAMTDAEGRVGFELPSPARRGVLCLAGAAESGIQFLQDEAVVPLDQTEWTTLRASYRTQLDAEFVAALRRYRLDLLERLCPGTGGCLRRPSAGQSDAFKDRRTAAPRGSWDPSPNGTGASAAVQVSEDSFSLRLAELRAETNRRICGEKSGAGRLLELARKRRAADAARLEESIARLLQERAAARPADVNTAGASSRERNRCASGSLRPRFRQALQRLCRAAGCAPADIVRRALADDQIDAAPLAVVAAWGELAQEADALASAVHVRSETAIDALLAEGSALLRAVQDAVEKRGLSPDEAWRAQALAALPKRLTDPSGQEQATDASLARRVSFAGRLVERVPLRIESLPSISRAAGVIERLNNLGFDAGPSGDDITDSVAEAIRRFQYSEGVELSGQMDDTTTARLAERQGFSGQNAA